MNRSARSFAATLTLILLASCAAQARAAEPTADGEIVTITGVVGLGAEDGYSPLYVEQNGPGGVRGSRATYWIKTAVFGFDAQHEGLSNWEHLRGMQVTLSGRWAGAYTPTYGGNPGPRFHPSTNIVEVRGHIQRFLGSMRLAAEPAGLIFLDFGDPLVHDPDNREIHSNVGPNGLPYDGVTATVEGVVGPSQLWGFDLDVTRVDGEPVGMVMVRVTRDVSPGPEGSQVERGARTSGAGAGPEDQARAGGQAR